MADATLEQVVTALRTRILSQSAVTNLIGTRLYLVDAGENPPTPYATFSVDVLDVAKSHEGQGGFETFQLEVEVSAKSSVSAIRIAQAIRGAIVNFSGDVAGTFINTVSLSGQSSSRNAKGNLFGQFLDFTVYV